MEFRRELRELRSDCSDSCRLRRAKARTQNIAPLSLEGVFQMDSILPERLLALVRPAFDLVLQRIRSLRRCVQACGCEAPRHHKEPRALQNGALVRDFLNTPNLKRTRFDRSCFFRDPTTWAWDLLSRIAPIALQGLSRRVCSLEPYKMVPF